MIADKYVDHSKRWVVSQRLGGSCKRGSQNNNVTNGSEASESRKLVNGAERWSPRKMKGELSCYHTAEMCLSFGKKPYSDPSYYCRARKNQRMEIHTKKN